MWAGQPTPADITTHRSIAVHQHGHWLRRMLGFIGPGYLGPAQ